MQSHTIDLNSAPVHTNPLPQTTDVLIIGGGIIGIATALELAEQGVAVVVCEKGRVAAEQSSRNWGWIRQTCRDAAELPLMIESLEIWKNLAARTGQNALTFHEQGVLYVSQTAQSTSEHEEFARLAATHNVDSRILTREQVQHLMPAAAGNCVSGLWTPSDGRVEPWHAVPALAKAAANAGATIIEHCAVRSVERTGGQVSSVLTEQGSITCNRVLLAGGAWSVRLAQQLGVYLPQLAVKSTAVRLENVPEIFSGNTADDGLAFCQRPDGAYTMALKHSQEHFIGRDSFRLLRPYRQGAIKKWRSTKFHISAPENFPDAWQTARRWAKDSESPFEKCRVLNPQADRSTVDRMLELLHKRSPAYTDARVSHAWAGMIDSMPDFVPVMDECEHWQGLFIATGFSGHGFGIGPCAGRIMAKLLMGHKVDHDISRFRLTRFTDGSALELGPI